MNLLHLGRQVVRRYPQRLLPHSTILVHPNRRFRTLCLEEHRLGFRPLLALHTRLGLCQLHVEHRGRVVVFRDAHRPDPVLLVHVHVDCLLRLIRLDELSLGVGEPALVFQEHGVFEVYVRQFRLETHARELEGVGEGAALHGVIDSLLQQPELLEQHRAPLAPQGHRPRVRHLLARVGSSVVLGDPDGVLPQLVGAIHLDRALPVFRLEILLLGVAPAVVTLQLLRQVEVRLGEKIFPERRHQTDHVVVHAVLLVHVDGQVVLLDGQVHLLGLLPALVGLELPRALRVQQRCLGVRHVPHGHLVRRLPPIRATVHLHRLARLPRTQKAPLRLIVLAGLLVVPRDAAIVRLKLAGPGPAAAARLRVHDLERFLPVAALHRRLDGFDALAGFDEVVDGGVHLFHLHQVVAPPLL
mmetsp:Transcript_36111/g.90175  ORF Transcript_36111/g.90175 Transcript_36111/m.90175 type:complete len:413 (-) Transcript_36111:1159-2397(-)